METYLRSSDQSNILQITSDRSKHHVYQFWEGSVELTIVEADFHFS